MNFSTVLLMTLALGLSVVTASARPRMSLERLPLIIEDASAPNGMRKLGPLGRCLGALSRAKHVCELGTYAYGANLSCRTTARKMVYIGIAAVPTHEPEFASVQDIRPDEAVGLGLHTDSIGHGSGDQ